MTQFNENRQFIRHAVEVPLEVSVVDHAPIPMRQGLNISFGGLAFLFEEPIEVGTIIQLKIPTVHPPFEARARVVWCRPEGDKYCVGVAFMDSTDAFQSRMVEQVCAIEVYRQQALDEGRVLNMQEAAAEWIEKHAGSFPT